MAHTAKNVVCCNYDRKPGYSGVENPLYQNHNTLMLCGDAKASIQQIAKALNNGKPEGVAVEEVPADNVDRAAQALASADQVIIIPGYGMALARAQFDIVELAGMLTQNGTRVKYAIHPVAGRMPGHMNVILAEAEVDYDDLMEMDEINPLFEDTDVALVVGACDVVNPAAIEVAGTPISGMPILLAHKARHVVVCNYDAKPGYSGVANPLYDNSNTIALFGDAKRTAADLMRSLNIMENISPRLPAERMGSLR